MADQVRVRADAVVPNRRRGGDIRVTLSPRTVGCGSGFGGVLYLAPGEFVTEHYHPYSEEFLHVVTGELTIALDGRPVTLAPGDSLLVPIGVRHRLVNEGADRAHAVFHLSPLAPRPELGHVDTEEPVAPHAAQPRVGPAPAGAPASGAGAAAGSAEPRPEDTR
ncbi:cupin domain-containing protein [Streptomyces armeniacus]|uniref:Cupin domain-containing protein n=1 Tax=Streptomyces armeniacus TaxID=83291 RepID=A0A345XZU6_9ACTN|nr:cupin domain-containing protein [Streptomyces armeniacus]AXK37162.1 cupin domain-containing protein [Streptomyces armeniacus]